VELIRGIADEPETRLDLRNRRVMISTTVIAGPKLWRHGGDEAVAGPDYWLEPRRSAVAIRIALRHSTRFILAILPSARGIPGLPVAQRSVLSPQSTRTGVRPIARMPIGVPIATRVVNSSAPPQMYLRSRRLAPPPSNQKCRYAPPSGCLTCSPRFRLAGRDRHPRSLEQCAGGGNCRPHTGHDWMQAEEIASDQDASRQLLMVPLETECRNRTQSSADR